MKLSLPLKLATLATVVLSSIMPFDAAKAATYDEKQVDQNEFIAVAAPYGNNKYNLLIIEQIPGKKQCWSENGTNPIAVDPLLLSFDFTGHCKRSTDSNGYSIRVDGQDHGLDYLLSLVERNGELQLIGTSRTNPGQAGIVVGRTGGLSQGGFMKIVLNPGWQFTKRTYQGKELGHVYFSGNGSAIATENSSNSAPVGSSMPNSTTPANPSTPVNPINPANQGTPSNPVNPGNPNLSSITGVTGPGAMINNDSTTNSTTVDSSSGFRDIATDTYKSEIEQAVAMGFIAGFKEDNTFRPEQSLTREQLVSMVIGALDSVPELKSKTATASSVSSTPYPDVQASRWSAAKIEWAKQNQVVKGYPDGSFRPDKPVTRAELMAVLRRAAEFAKVQRGLSPDLTAAQSPMTFLDTNGHWGEPLIGQMSSYCRVASPLNESGNSFYPDRATGRDYAAAATLRMSNCLKTEAK
jgi:N-acetylmuramoyl-L-alanine amidase